jgi:lactosylceramide 4-alpha-galactosyltransferase
MNPDLDIYYIFTTKADKVKLEVNELVKVLYSYSNIHLRFANVLEYSKGTRLQNFFERDALGNSSYPLQHASDVFRGLTLNKFGGQYLDTDAISLVPIKSINWPNFACAEEDNIIAPGIMALDLDWGKKISDKYLE